MTVSGVRSSGRLSPWTRTLLALIGIPALLVGFMAMHALSSESAVPAETLASAQALAVPEAEAAASGDALHDVATLACVFALAVALFLAVPALSLRLGQAPRTYRPVLLANSRMPWPQVSLDLLSISRT